MNKQIAAVYLSVTVRKQLFEQVQCRLKITFVNNCGENSVIPLKVQLKYRNLLLRRTS